MRIFLIFGIILSSLMANCQVSDLVGKWTISNNINKDSLADFICCPENHANLKTCFGKDIFEKSKGEWIKIDKHGFIKSDLFELTKPDYMYCELEGAADTLFVSYILCDGQASISIVIPFEIDGDTMIWKVDEDQEWTLIKKD